MSFDLQLQWVGSDISLRFSQGSNVLPDVPDEAAEPQLPLELIAQLDPASKFGKSLVREIKKIMEALGAEGVDFESASLREPASIAPTPPSKDQLRSILDSLSIEDRNKILQPFIDQAVARTKRKIAKEGVCKCSASGSCRKESGGCKAEGLTVRIDQQKKLLSGFTAEALEAKQRFEQIEQSLKALSKPLPATKTGALWDNLNQRLTVLEKQLQALPPEGSKETKPAPQQESPPREPQRSSLVERIQSGNWSPLQCAAELNKTQNKQIAKAFGLSTAGAEMDVVMRYWPKVFPDANLGEALKRDFTGLHAKEIASKGTANSSRVLCQFLKLPTSGNELDRSKRIHLALNNEG